MNISFNFHYSKIKEKAPAFPHSRGNSKKRLHLFGAQEKDRFAVAAKQITSKDKTSPKLNWFEKKFYVLVSDPQSNGEIWYKVNKNSLKKRFQISEKELKAPDASILDLINEKYSARKQWEQVMDPILHGCPEPYWLPSRFIDALVTAGIKPDRYKGLAFWSLQRYCYFFTSDGASAFKIMDEKDNDPLNLRNYEKGQILSVIYRDLWMKDHRNLRNPRNNIADPAIQKHVDFVNGPDSPLTVIELDERSVKAIMDKGEFPPEILRQLA